MSMKIINLTPHVVNVQDSEGIQSFPSEGIARVQTSNKTFMCIENDIPVSRVVYGATEGLPEPKENTLVIVSMVVAQANPTRHDLICPDSSPSGAIRNAEGQITAVKGFVCYASASPYYMPELTPPVI